MKRQDDGSMTVSTWARSRGLSPSAAFRAIRDGRIMRRLDGRLDPEEADAHWRANTRAKSDSPFRGMASKPPSAGDYEMARLRRKLLAARVVSENSIAL